MKLLGDWLDGLIDFIDYIDRWVDRWWTNRTPSKVAMAG